MSWFQSILKPFQQKEQEEAAATKPTAGMPELPKEIADTPEAKGMMGLFYRKWKDPAFVKQLKTIALYMQKDGVNVKNMGDVKAWLEKNKDALEAGKFKEPPPSGDKPVTYVKTGPDIGRNDPCHCGSGKKFKKCHGVNAG